MWSHFQLDLLFSPRPCTKVVGKKPRWQLPIFVSCPLIGPNGLTPLFKSSSMLYLDRTFNYHKTYIEVEIWDTKRATAKSGLTLQWELQIFQKHQLYTLQQPFENLNGQAKALYTVNDFNNSFILKSSCGFSFNESGVTILPQLLLTNGRRTMYCTWKLSYFSCSDILRFRFCSKLELTTLLAELRIFTAALTPWWAARGGDRCFPTHRHIVCIRGNITIKLQMDILLHTM